MTTNERVRARQTSNEARVLRAEAALNGYRKSVHRGYVPQRKDEADLRDLLTDLRHWAKAKGRAFRTELAKSRDYFRTEDAPAEPMRFDPCRGVSSIRAADAARQIALLLDGRDWAVSAGSRSASGFLASVERPMRGGSISVMEKSTYW